MNYLLTTQTEDELYHYGVKGMKWGITRASRQLKRADTPEKRNKAVEKLEKHRQKVTKKIESLDYEKDRLKKKLNKAMRKTNPKIAKLNQQTLKLKKKANSFWTSEEKTKKLLAKAENLEMKSAEMKAKVDVAKAAFVKNRSLASVFKNGISEIDELLKK